jgi:hypothetical protein
MRTSSLLAAFALSSLAGCTYYVQELPRTETGQSGGGDRCTSSSSDHSTAADETSDEDDANENTKPYASLPREEGTFELVARFVLRSIPYRDCGTGGRGDLDITFMPNGSVQKIVVWAYAWSEPTKQCVSERFAIAHVTPFAGDARTVRWHTALDDGGWGT